MSHRRDSAPAAAHTHRQMHHRKRSCLPFSDMPSVVLSSTSCRRRIPCTRRSVRYRRAQSSLRKIFLDMNSTFLYFQYSTIYAEYCPNHSTNIERSFVRRVSASSAHMKVSYILSPMASTGHIQSLQWSHRQHIPGMRFGHGPNRFFTMEISKQWWE